MVAFGSGTTDPYQPREAQLELTRRCAELLAATKTAAGFLPAMVMTKSSLALRDLATWKAINAHAGFLLMVSLASLDEEVRQAMEPGASSVEDRLNLIRTFKEAGCSVGVLAMPFLPGISDSEASISRIYQAGRDLGVDFIMPGGLTLRPGRQKDLYLETLRNYRPDLLESTQELYNEDRPSGAPRSDASRSLFRRVASIQQDYALPYLLPHPILASLLPAHDALRILFRDMVELYRERGVDTRGLVMSAAAYDTWLVGLRRAFRKRRNLPPSWLDERFSEALTTGELDSILENRKLSSFVYEVVLKKARFDYRSLRLKPFIN
jgi:hypothetical protein